MRDTNKKRVWYTRDVGLFGVWFPEDTDDKDFQQNERTLGAWCTSCMLCLILVINRILAILHPALGKMYFKG